MFNLDKQLKEPDKTYFEKSSVDAVLDLVCEKTCKPFMKKPPVQQEEQQKKETVQGQHTSRRRSVTQDGVIRRISATG